MDENKELEEHVTPEPEKKKSWFASSLGILFLLTLVGVGGYYGYQKIVKGFSTKGMFTKYKPIVTDTLTLPTDTTSSVEENLDDSVNSILSTQDSIDFINENFGSADSTVDSVMVVENPNPPIEEEDSNLSDLFKVNTTYDEIDDDIVLDTLEVVDNNILTSDGLFEELLLSEEMDKALVTSFDKFANQKIVSSKGVLKLLAIAGKQVLLGKDTEDVKAILGILIEAEEVKGVMIADRKGKIVYATNQKYVNFPLRKIIPQVDVNMDNLSWIENGEERIVAMPLYHTYGKIGYAILVSK